jgi:hypothetical protein
MSEQNQKITAMVLDGEVVELFRTDERLAAIFLSKPLAIDVTDNEPRVLTGMKYDAETKKFY